MTIPEHAEQGAGAETTLGDVELYQGGFNYYGRFVVSPDALVFIASRRRHVLLEVAANSIGFWVALALWRGRAWYVALGLGALVGTIVGVGYYFFKRRQFESAARGTEIARFRFGRGDLARLKPLPGGKIALVRAGETAPAAQLEPTGEAAKVVAETLQRFGWPIT